MSSSRFRASTEEQLLDYHLLQRLRAADSEGRIDFDDPDVIIAIETLGQTAGLSCWTREERQSFEMLKLD